MCRVCLPDFPVHKYESSSNKHEPQHTEHATCSAYIQYKPTMLPVSNFIFNTVNYFSRNLWKHLCLGGHSFNEQIPFNPLFV